MIESRRNLDNRISGAKIKAPCGAREVMALEKKEELSYTIRYSATLHKQLKFLAVDRELSLNKLIISILDREVRESRVSLPTSE